jgi:hypothetical protein
MGMIKRIAIFIFFLLLLLLLIGCTNMYDISWQLFIKINNDIQYKVIVKINGKEMSCEANSISDYFAVTFFELSNPLVVVVSLAGYYGNTSIEYTFENNKRYTIEVNYNNFTNSNELRIYKE